MVAHWPLPLTPVLWSPCCSCFSFCPFWSLGLHVCVHTAQPHTTWFRVPLDPVLYTGPPSSCLSPLLCPFMDPSFPYPVFLPPSSPLSLGILPHLRGSFWSLVDEVISLSPGAVCFPITLYHHDVHSRPQDCLGTGQVQGLTQRKHSQG